MATSINTILEKRVLTRTLRVPDFYPQDPKQKEDELTSVNVKQGFINQIPIYGEGGEHGSAQHYQVDVKKLNKSFADILQQKQIINTWNDTGKKRPPLTKDNFWLVPVAKNRNHLQQWINDLRLGKNLLYLGKRVPIFSKKEEVFQILAEKQITIARGTWYIKMTAAYNALQAEAKNKKNRTTADHNPEWTVAICKFMRDQLARLLDDPTLSSSGSSTLQPPMQLNKEDMKKEERQFNYICKIAHHMYTEGMLDPHEFLTWVVETMEKIRLHGTHALSYVMPLVVKYTQEIAKNQLLSRRMAFVACRLLGWLLNESTWGSPTPKSAQVESPAAPSSVGPPSVSGQPTQRHASAPSTPGQPAKPSSPQKGAQQVHPSGRKPYSLPTNFPEFLEDIAYGLICVIQCITLECPGALVWYPSDEPKTLGSPLDYLPVATSRLPLPPPPRKSDKRAEADDKHMRASLREKEHDITQRSYAAEMRWSSDKCQESATGQTINRVLSTLEALDKHQNFDRTDPIEQLYNKIFVHNNNKENNNQTANTGEEAVIWLLCEWALSAKRLGEHRAAVVAKLLDKRQMHIESERAAEIADRIKAMNSSATVSSNSNPNSIGPVLASPPPQLLVEGAEPPQTEHQTPPAQMAAVPDLLGDGTHSFQNLLFNFLDTQAPLLDNPSNKEELQSFKNLVVLFSELIQHDVFSHDEYVSALISRGDIVPGQISPLPVFSPTSSVNLSYPVANCFNHRNNSVGIPSVGPASAGGPVSNKPPDILIKGEVDDDLPSSVRSLDPKNDSAELGGLFSPISTSELLSPDNRQMGERHFTDGLTTLRTDLGDNPKDKLSGHGPAQIRRPTGPIWGYRQPRHVQFLMHFPISFEDEDSVHESNQRLMVLYGAGRQRNEVKKAVKKITKFVCKLVQKKSVTSTEGSAGLVLTPIPSVGSSGKKSKTRSGESSCPPSPNALLKRFRCLSYFDQHAVTSQAAQAIISSFNDYVADRSQNLPQMTSITLVLNLMKEGLNIGGMVQLAVQIASTLTSLESEIGRKHPSLAGCYTKDLALNVVAVLRHYQSYLTLNVDLTLQAFNAMHAFVKQSNIANPGHCTSPDRCVLIFLYDLYSSFPYRSKVVLETFAGFTGFASAIRQALCQSKIPATSNCRYDNMFLAEYIQNPNSAHPLIVARQNYNRLREATNTYKYSFVCSAIISMCSGQPNPESLSAIATLCAEMNAQCNDLSSEWLGVLKALCCSSCTANFNDVLLCVDPNDAMIRDPLALFTAILIARNCLSLEDFIQHVAIPSLLAACPSKPGLDVSDAEIGARLTCHILLQLFKTPTHPSEATESESSSTERPSFYLPEAADRHLLAASQRNIVVGAVLAVLKAIVKLGDTTFGGRHSATPSDNDTGVTVTSFLAPIGGMDECDDFSLNGPTKPPLSATNSLDKASLSQFAKHAVRVICSQQWVRERCLKNIEWDLLMDQELTREQRQNLIQLICCPEEELKRLAEDSQDQYSYVLGVLQRMSRWTLRQTLLELQIMLKQAGHDESLSEDIAKAIIDVFKNQNIEPTRDRKSPITGVELDRSNAWLMPPLVSELSSQVQAKVLHEASMILETFQHWSRSKSDRDRNSNKNSASLLSQQPFLTLILTCLKGQDEQRDSLLDSLQSQIIMFQSDWSSGRQQNMRDASGSRDGSMSLSVVQEALQLRLSLMGGMFDTVQNSSHWTSNVVVLLTQLISSGMVDAEVSAKLFNTVVDMIAVLLHCTLGGDSPQGGEGSKKDYTLIVRKINREIGDGQTTSLNILRRLLPVPRKETYVIAVEPTTSGSDSHGQHKVASKHKINPWDVIEGLKHSAPLCLSWFGAIKTERKELPYEIQQRLMLSHDHDFWQQSESEYLRPPVLPEEEEEKHPSPVVPKKRKSSSTQRVKSPGGGVSHTTKDALQPPIKKSRANPKPRKNSKKSQDGGISFPARQMSTNMSALYNRPQVMVPQMPPSQPMPSSAVPGYDGNPGAGGYVYQPQMQQQTGNPGHYGNHPALANKAQSAHIKQNLAHLIKTKSGHFGPPQQQTNQHHVGGMHMHTSQQAAENSKSAIRTMIARTRNIAAGPTNDIGGMPYRARQPGTMGPPIATMRQMSGTAQPQAMGGYNNYMNSQQGGMGQMHMIRQSYNSYQAGAGPPQQQQGYHQSMQNQSYINQAQNQGYSMSNMPMQGQASSFGMQSGSVVQNQSGMMSGQQPPQYGMMPTQQQQQQQGRQMARMNPQQQMSGGGQSGMMQMHGMGGTQNTMNDPMNRQHMMLNQGMPMNSQYTHRMATPQQQTTAQLVSTLRRNMPNQGSLQGYN